ncbi:hypothetical protein RHO13_12900 [Orbus wheelerorum]
MNTFRECIKSKIENFNPNIDIFQFCYLPCKTGLIIYQHCYLLRNFDNQLTLFSGNDEGLAGGEAEFIKQVTF